MDNGFNVSLWTDRCLHLSTGNSSDADAEESEDETGALDSTAKI